MNHKKYKHNLPTAQYKDDIARMHKLSILVEFRGSIIGRLIADEAKLISIKVEERLKLKDISLVDYWNDLI